MENFLGLFASIDNFFGFLTRSTVAIVTFLGVFWKGDESLLSESGRKLLFANLVSSVDTPFHPLIIMDRYFSPQLPGLRFVLNVLLFSLASLFLLLFTYITWTPGFWNQLLTDGLARMHFFREVLLYGLPTTFIVNYLGFMGYSYFAHSGTNMVNLKVRHILIIDLLARVALFVAVTTIIFIAFAHFTDEAFLGSKVRALKSVGPTLAYAAVFQDLSGVYLYATAISAFPLFVGACIEAMQESPPFSRLIRGVFFFLPFADRPIRSVAVVVGTFFAIFSAVALGVASIV
jgi:hypothetical protein